REFYADPVPGAKVGRSSGEGNSDGTAAWTVAARGRRPDNPPKRLQFFSRGVSMNLRFWLVGALVPVVAMVPALAAPAQVAKPGGPATPDNWPGFVPFPNLRSE